MSDFGTVLGALFGGGAVGTAIGAISAYGRKKLENTASTEKRLWARVDALEARRDADAQIILHMKAEMSELSSEFFRVADLLRVAEKAFADAQVTHQRERKADAEECERKTQAAIAEAEIRLRHAMSQTVREEVREEVSRSATPQPFPRARVEVFEPPIPREEREHDEEERKTKG